MRLRFLPLFTFLLVSLYAYSYTYDDFVWDFEWLEPNNTVEIGVGESHQLLYACSTNYDKVFSEDMASNWVHIDLTPYQHVVNPPTGYSIDENGIITGKVEGKYVIHPTGLIQPKDQNNDWLWINVVSFHEEKEPNNILETANTLGYLPTQFYLSTIADVDWFKIHVTAGEKLQFHIKGTTTFPMIKWATFGGTDLSQISGGSVSLTDGEQIINIGSMTSFWGTGDYYIQFYANPDFYNYFQNFCYYTVQAVIEKEPIPGDVNGDGEINIADVNSVLDVILGGSNESTVDVNLDGEVNIADVNAIINIIIGEMPSTYEPENETFCVNGISFTMVGVEGGSFTMGATAEQGNRVNDDELPAHKVTLSNYYIGETEVTQALWQAVMGTNPSRFTGDLNRPVEQIWWYYCQTFITRLNELTGQSFRLPTEAEWEFAARGGNKSKGYKYSGSNDIDAVAWYVYNANNTTHPVGQKAPNELGLYDMSGNVFEWCSDYYDNYGSDDQVNPTGPSYGSSCVFRGGAWLENADGCRVSCRYNNGPSYYWDSVMGLRLAL